jgi:hypothetical protein
VALTASQKTMMGSSTVQSQATAATAPAQQPPPQRYRTAESAIVDRRRSVRIAHRAAFNVRQILSDGVGPAIMVILQDLSASGMGVLHSQPMRLGDVYQIPLTQQPTAAAAGGMTLVATVMRCERMDDDLFSIGFAFNSSAAAVDAGSRQITGEPAP